MQWTILFLSVYFYLGAILTNGEKISQSAENEDNYVVESRKRQAPNTATTCSFSAQALYPPECSSATDGAKCLSTNLCGCAVDTDCFGNTDYPFCVNGACEPCTIKASATNSNGDHLACLPRYPGMLTQPTDGSTLPNERAAPLNYFREFCVRSSASASGGACQRCNQAVPVLPFGFASLASNQGATGTVFCNGIRPNRPICMDQTYMTDVGGTFDINFRGACRPCNISQACFRALPATPICNVAGGNCVSCSANAQCGQLTGAANCQKDGSCKSCLSDSDCGALDGGEKVSQPTCDKPSGICQDIKPCANNNDCVGKSGSNCQKDGTCKTCLKDSDCGSLDGGETPNQSSCNTAHGICVTPFKCVDNDSCQGNGGNNCQADFSCISCTSQTCGVQDGGVIPGQPNCNSSSRQCVNACKINNDCVLTQGANCMTSGLCVTCHTNADCNVDGGEVAGQSECNVNTGICQTPFKCKDNPSCASQPGKNCQADLSCKTCLSSSDCGVLDGGEIPGQPICIKATGQCDKCHVNADCPANAPNCGANGGCYQCSSTVPSRGCGALDAGEVQNQPNCDDEQGLCVSGCTLDSHCNTSDICKPHCNVAKGCCVECSKNSHCPLAQWRQSEKEILTVCSTLSSTCVKGCSVDDDCKGTPSTPACAATLGICVPCLYHSHCAATPKTPYCNPSDLVCTDVNGWGAQGLDGLAGIIIGSFALFFAVVIIFVLLITKGASSGERF